VSPDGAPGARIEPGMFRGPKRLDPCLPLLRRIPAPIARSFIIGLAIGDGILRKDRLRSAIAWAGAQAEGSKWPLAFALLANHGRFIADEAMIGVGDASKWPQRVRIEGRERLAALSGGAILLGFHLGPPRTAFMLRSLGIPVHLTGRLQSADRDGRWAGALQASQAVRLPAGAPRGRAEGLHHIRGLLRRGALVYLAADGPFGREAFRIDLPGGPLVARLGWFTLRRITGVPTLPVLTWQSRGGRVIAIHPPLPPPHPDAAADAESCRSALTPLVEDYVRRFRAQCRYLAFPLAP
jgi:lauroyl/myristoyl acyltransferase